MVAPSMAGLAEGLTVLDLGEYISAPYCARVLGILGASVVKVEPPSGDVARRMGPFPGDIPHPEKSGLFLALNVNKKGLTLDLQTAEGRKVLLRLAESADIVVDNHPPDYLAALGLSHDTLRAGNPRLVFVSITPFGASGERRAWQATDLTLYHMAGHAMELPVADPDRDAPIRSGGHQTGFLAGSAALVATFAALYERTRSGEGCYINLSELEAVASVVSWGPVTTSTFPGGREAAQREGVRRGVHAEVLPCKDGYVVFSPREDAQWAHWLEVMGNPGWANETWHHTSKGRTEHAERLYQLVSEWSMTQTKQDLYQACQAHHVPCFPVNTTSDLLQDRQLRHRGFFQYLDHPLAGALPYTTFPAHFTNAACRLETPAPLLGQHNAEVLMELGYSAQDLPRLAAAGVI